MASFLSDLFNGLMQKPYIPLEKRRPASELADGLIFVGTRVPVRGPCDSKPKTQKNALKTVLVLLRVLSFLSDKILTYKAMSKYGSKRQNQPYTILFVLCLLHVPLTQWFSTGTDFAPQGTHDNVWKHFWLSELGGRDDDIQWVEASEAA